MSYHAKKLFALSCNGEKKTKIRSCDLELWPMTLKFNRVHAVVKVHVQAKFQRANVQRFLSYHAYREKNWPKTLLTVATAWRATTTKTERTGYENDSGWRRMFGSKPTQRLPNLIIRSILTDSIDMYHRHLDIHTTGIQPESTRMPVKFTLHKVV